MYILQDVTHWVQLVFDDDFSTVRVILDKKNRRETRKLSLKTVRNTLLVPFYFTKSSLTDGFNIYTVKI